MGALYQIEFPNGKSYIGITTQTPAARLRSHSKDAKHRKGDWAVHRALRKYGTGNVVLRTLAIANDWAYLQLIERNAIRVFGTFGKGGYNMTAGGDGFLGGRHTPESKAKIAEAGRNISPETRKKIGDAFRGKPGSNLGSKHDPAANDAKSLRQLKSKTLSSRNTSGHKGVSWNKGAKKWMAYFKTHGAYQYLGLFVDKAAAVAAREAAVAAHLSRATP